MQKKFIFIMLKWNKPSDQKAQKQLPPHYDVEEGLIPPKFTQSP